MNDKIKYCFIIILFAISANSIRSQYIYDTLQLIELEVISAQFDHRSTTKTTSIDSIARNQLSLEDIGELIAVYTPVFVKSYGKGSLSTVSLRGTGASHTKVLWEGFDINSPMLGQTDFSTLPGVFFDDIELMYGGSSLTGTGGALGGSVSLKSNVQKSSDEIINFQQSFGSFNTYQTSLCLNLSKGNFTSGTRLFRQSSDNNFEYYNNAILPEGKVMKQTDAEFSNFGFTQHFGIALSETQNIEVATWNQWNTRNIPTIMTNIEKGGDQHESQDDFFTKNIVTWTRSTIKSKLELKAAYFFEDLKYNLHTLDSLGTTISLIDSENSVTTWSLNGSFSTVFQNNIILKTSIKTDLETVESNNYNGIKKRNLLTAMVSLKKQFLGKIDVEGLVRSEISDIGVIPAMPLLGINYKPISKSDLHFRLVFSQNQNIPSLNDLYWFPGGNEDLKPEKSTNAEFGIDYLKGLTNSHNIFISSSIYSSQIKDWIIWLPGDYRYWSPENIASVYSRGVELSCKINGKLWQFDYIVNAEYAYTRTTNNSSFAKENGLHDVQLVYVPEHTFVGYANINYRGYNLTWSVSYTGSRNTSLNNDENYSFTLPPFTLNNLSFAKNIGIKSKEFGLMIKVNNIFNIDYQAVLWRAMPGRNFEISLKANI